MAVKAFSMLFDGEMPLTGFDEKERTLKEVPNVVVFSDVFSQIEQQSRSLAISRPGDSPLNLTGTMKIVCPSISGRGLSLSLPSSGANRQADSLIE